LVGGGGTGQIGEATATLPLVGGGATGQIGEATATLPLVGGGGTGQIGEATATLPLVGGGGTGQIGEATATLPLVGGGGTGQIGLVTFPRAVGRTGLKAGALMEWFVGSAWTAGFGLATAMVTAITKSAATAELRKFRMNAFI
jgi:hypothetical protein